MYTLPTAEITGLADAELFVAAVQNHPSRTEYPHVRTPHLPALKELLLSLQKDGCMPNTPLNRIACTLESMPLFPRTINPFQQWHNDPEYIAGEELYTIADAMPLQWVEGVDTDGVDPYESVESLIERGLTVASAGRLAVVRVHPGLIHRRPPNDTDQPIPRNHALFVVNDY